MAVDQAILDLARAYRIDTEFWDWKGHKVEVSEETIVAVLAAMEVDASTPEAAHAAREAFERRPWTRRLPPCVVVEEGQGKVFQVHVPADTEPRVYVKLEDGGEWWLSPSDNWAQDREIDGVTIAEHSFWLPDDLPLGYHRLHLQSGDVETESVLVVTPRFLGFPHRMGDRRVWGYAAQLYSVSGEESWGIGDLADLRDLAIWSATQQFASYVLINPLHASQPVPPIEPSPYLPASRRYVNPLYICVEAIHEYARLSDGDRARIRRIKEDLRRKLSGSRRLQRDPVLAAKLEALRIIHHAGLPAGSQMAKDDFVRREGRGLYQFATWCVLAKHYGPKWREWPEEYQRPSSRTVSEFATEHADEVDFYIWLQWIADMQLRRAQSSALDAGMHIGVMNDIAVGVSKDSAEAWSLPDVFATGVSAGAPADYFNQYGQDWGQMPWRPDRLDDLAYAPFRTMVAGILRHSGGIRVDHVMGLFRLWWVPEGKAPTDGTYVRFNHEAMVGILVLEAYRAGALVVGEDLGTVEPWVRDYLRDRGILGTSILWFEGDENGPIDPSKWREYCMASVTTHDLPPTAGYLELSHVKLRHELGLLSEPLEDELATGEREVESWVAKLQDLGLLSEDESLDEGERVVLALHRYLTMTSSRVLCAALTDAVGDRSTQNQPGTSDEYPNWRVPLSGPDGTPMSLEDVFTSERALRLSAVMNQFRSTPRAVRRGPSVRRVDEQPKKRGKKGKK